MVGVRPEHLLVQSHNIGVFVLPWELEELWRTDDALGDLFQGVSRLKKAHPPL